MLSEKYPQFQKYQGLLFFLVLASLVFSMKLNSLFIILLVLQWLLMVPLAEKKKKLETKLETNSTICCLFFIVCN